MAVEYDNRIPKALIEYKAVGARVNVNDANNTAIRNLADMAGIPAFVVFYNRDSARFGVVPMNERAKPFLANRTVYSEQEYSDFLHRIRGRKCCGSLS